MSDQVGYIPEQLWQKLDEFLSDDLNLTPEQAARYFLTNLVGRNLSYLMGWNYSTGRPNKVSTNPDGTLRVSSTGSIFQTNESTQLNLAAGASQNIVFNQLTSRLDIWAIGTDLQIERSVDGVLYQNSITIYSGGYLSVDANQLALKVTNPSGTTANTGQVVGWY